MGGNQQMTDEKWVLALLTIVLGGVATVWFLLILTSNLHS